MLSPRLTISLYVPQTPKKAQSKPYPAPYRSFMGVGRPHREIEAGGGGIELGVP